MGHSDAPDQGLQASLDRALPLLAELEAAVAKHGRLIAIQNAAMVALLLATLGLVVVMTIFTRAFLAQY